MNFKSNQPAIFTAQTYGTKTTVEIDHCDLDLDEVMNAFQTLIVGMGYSNDALKHWVLEKAEEYKEDEPEYDGAGFRHEDNFGGHTEIEHSNSHWNKLSEKEEWLENRLSEDSFPHYVTNEEADEDAKLHMKTSFPMVNPFTTEEAEYNYRVKGETPESDYFAAMVQDEQRYEDSLRGKRGAITQRLLDYVDSKGAVTYGELHEYYKSITGSNSFSHILKALRIPYKNRPTQRYLAKEGKPYSNANYIVKLANPSNWVVVDDYDEDFKTFNEAPYGDN